MAGDWIKMRVSLVTHPKVMAIAEFLADKAEYQEWSTLSGFVPSYGGGSERTLRNERHSALRVTRYVTVCALLRFWGYANEHARDEFIALMTVDDIDEIAQVPAFGIALQAVGWIESSDEPIGIGLPNFAEFNAVADERQSGGKAAERQRRYRERLKTSQSDGESDVTRDVTRDGENDVTVTSRNAPREEKRREEKKETKTKEERAPRFDAQAHLESLGVDSQVARDWITHRKAKKAAPTETAIDGIDKEARKAGITLQAALTVSCQRGWQGFNAEWMNSAQGVPRSLSWSEKNDEVIAQLTGRNRYEPDDRTIDV